jgi:hypothetical protein
MNRKMKLAACGPQFQQPFELDSDIGWNESGSRWKLLNGVKGDSQFQKNARQSARKFVNEDQLNLRL